MELEIINLHWLDGSSPEGDYCVHGAVRLIVGDKDFGHPDDEWTLSTTGLYLLRMIEYDYPKDNWWGNQLFPCCGHTFLVNDRKEDLEKGFVSLISGCPTGHDFLLFHKGETVLIECGDQTEVISKKNWQNIVLKFTDRIEDEYAKCKKDSIDDEYDKRGYELFWQEWNSRKLRLRLLVGNPII